MEEPLITTEIKDRICTLTLNDPLRINATSDDMSTQFKRTVTAVAADIGVKVLVLTDRGD